MKPIYLRTEEDICKICTTSRDVIKYFDDMKFNNDQLHQVLRKMRFEFFSAGRTIFEHGAFGDKFYLII